MIEKRPLASGAISRELAARRCAAVWTTALALCLLASGAARLHAGDIKVDGKLVSTATTGTPPLAVSSTTQVSNLNADMVDGIHGAAFARKLENVVTVAKSGADFTSIQAAIDSITNAFSGNEWVVVIAPGTYNEYVTMKDYVSLVGSGRDETKISAGGGGLFGLAPTVTAAGATIRDLWIASNANNVGYAVGVYAAGFKPRIENVLVTAAGGTASSVGIYSTGSGRISIIGSEIRAPNGADAVGIWNFETSPIVSDSEVLGVDAGIRNVATSGGYIVDVDNSNIAVITGDAVDSDAEFETNIRYSRVRADLVANGGTFNCWFVIDKFGNALTSTCP